MKTRIFIPASESHPALHRSRQERIGSHDSTAGLIVAAFAGAFLLGIIGGGCLFLIFGLPTP